MTRPPLRPLLAWAAVGVAVWALVAQRGAAHPGEAVAAQARAGDALYAQHCAACHGPIGRGGSGEGLAAGPPLRGLEVALVDLQLRTGRMPIVAPEVGVTGPERLPDADRRAVVAWMAVEMDLEGEVPEVPPGDRARGHELYAIHCAACHGSLGSGGVGAGGTIIRDVLGNDRVAQVEAIRTGPYDMPRFDRGTLSDQDAADIATFVEVDLDNAPRTPLGLREMHRVTMWGMAAVVAGALLGLVVLVGHPVRAPEEPGAGVPRDARPPDARDGGGAGEARGG